MPTPTANISGDINAAIGEVSTIRATVVYSDPVWADETNNAVIVGGGVIPVSSTGAIDVDLPQTNETVRVAITLEYVDNATRQRKTATSGWQELTADTNLATFMALTPTTLPVSVADALDARIDALEGGGGGGGVAGVSSVNTRTGAVTLAKSDVGLSNVDNTSDANKPVSTAQAAADQTVLNDAASQAELLAENAFNGAIQRANHTGTQAISTVTGLQTALDSKAATTHTHGVTSLTATGTKDSTTFLRGDNTWAVPAGGGGGGGLARRGGVYKSPSNVFPASTVTIVTLATISGDSDVIGAGKIVIPTGAGGIWDITSTWMSNDGSAGRKFTDIKLNGSQIFRGSISDAEDRCTLAITLALVPGDDLEFACYSNSAHVDKRSEIEVHAYRVGV
ncbi:MAG: hypothetical protein ACRDZ2_07750 [Ilumatobacteraceae bacterium]